MFSILSSSPPRPPSHYVGIEVSEYAAAGEYIIMI